MGNTEKKLHIARFICIELFESREKIRMELRPLFVCLIGASRKRILEIVFWYFFWWDFMLSSTEVDG